MTYEPLHHKYRPQTFADLVGQEAIASTLTNALRQSKIAPAYLFTGPRGTGKTSSARIFAKSLNCLTTDQPTPTPCGQCETCKSITQGNSLDVIEIDAASNTGVDNIRELIEKAQFAPVQCRYKTYVIDECLTGDTLIQTETGLTRIDNPNLKNQKVLSYNESKNKWEYQRVLNWFNQGQRQILTLTTKTQILRCTPNHLIRTKQGWKRASSLQVGSQIYQPPQSILEPYSLTTIQSIQSGKTELVYDLEVAENHNFVANGLLVHNCHMLSAAAFNALLKTLEEPPDRVIFVLATTDPQRVLPTIISRCQRFDFRRIPLAAMVKHLSTIAEKEQIAITPEALTLVAQIAQGGLRDAESLLDQLSLSAEQVTPEQVWDLVGTVPERDLITLLEAIATGQETPLLEITRKILDRGREPLIVLQNLTSFYRDLLIAKTAPQRFDLVALTQTCWEQLIQLSQHWTSEQIIASSQHLRSCEVQIKNTTVPRLWLEVALIGLIPAKLTASASPLPAVPANPTPPPSVKPATVQPPIQPISIQPQPEAKSEVKPEPKPEVKAEPQPEPQIQPVYSAPIPTQFTSLDQVWHLALENIQFSTQVILKQHGKLTEINQGIIRINFSKAALLRLVQGKENQIASAFSHVLNQPVKVIFTVGDIKKSESTLNPTPPIPQPEAKPETKPEKRSEAPPPRPEPPRQEIPRYEPPPPQPQYSETPRHESTPENGSLIETSAKIFTAFFKGEILPQPTDGESLLLPYQDLEEKAVLTETSDEDDDEEIEF